MRKMKELQVAQEDLQLALEYTVSDTHKYLRGVLKHSKEMCV